MKILYYTGFFDQPLAAAEGFAPSLVRETCEVLTDPARIGEADAVVFHLPNLVSAKLPEKRKDQVWVALSVEASANYPIQDEENFMSRFDVRMMLRQDCDLPLTYFRPEMAPLFRTKPRKKFRSSPAVFFASNSETLSKRAVWLSELRRHLVVDCYGKGKLPLLTGRDRGRETRLRVIARYDFCLCLENALERDYVTEKIYDALLVGTVPVYRGAPNVEDFLPAAKCAVLADNFNGPADLAAYLLELRADRRRYEGMLAWRHEVFSEAFHRMMKINAAPSIVRLSRSLAMQRSEVWP